MGAECYYFFLYLETLLFHHPRIITYQLCIDYSQICFKKTKVVEKWNNDRMALTTLLLSGLITGMFYSVLSNTVVTSYM